MAAVVSRPAWRMLVLLIARYVINLINEHYIIIIVDERRFARVIGNYALHTLYQLLPRATNFFKPCKL